MGEPAEALDDIAVVPGVVRESDVFLAPGRRDLGRKPLERARAEPLELEILGMLERQVKERALRGNQRAIRALLDAGIGKTLRRRVLREGGCGAAVDVARELVEDDNERDPAAWRRGPLCVQLAATGAPVQLAELLAAINEVYATALSRPWAESCSASRRRS